MDGLTMKAALVIGVLLTLGFLWLVWKFFAKLFKHVLIMLILTALGMGFFYFRYRSFTPPPKPDIGKHAYMKNSGLYLGEVVSEGEDSVRGKVWIIRPLGSNYPVKYAKSKVTLKDKMELKPEPTPAPSLESKPASDKADKKGDTKKKKN
ncbi:MAG: hypothetical protein J2P52_00460 [Blastocatellia bacterium]|nr:hypothetical protein [Blastocatellia bacterium]